MTKKQEEQEIENLAHMLDDCELGECDGGCACGGDAGCAYGDAGGGISTGDVLGNCDHSSGGYMGAGCNHVPAPVMPMSSRLGWTVAKPKKSKKSKKRKTVPMQIPGDNPYVKGMTVITDSEIERALSEGRYSPRDIMNWEAHGRDPRFLPQERKPIVNARSLESELMRRFPGQFESVSLSDRPGRWTIDFKTALPDGQRAMKGQQRIATVIPEINRIMSFLRMRGVEINQYDVTATHVEGDEVDESVTLNAVWKRIQDKLN